MSNWKHAERRIAKVLKTTRTGPTGREDNDVLHPLLAVEIKYRASLPAWALACLEQARTATNAAGKVPAVFMLGKGMRVRDGLVVLRVRDFELLYGRIETSAPLAIDTALDAVPRRP